MSIFRKLIGRKTNETEKNAPKDERGEFMPEIKSPIDEQFMLNFKSNGGKFLYCESLDEVHKYFNAILNENGWFEKEVLLLDNRLKELFKNFDLKTSKDSLKSDYFLSTCEYLIANDGSLLICSNQIAEKRLKELPKNFIVYATTSQLIQNIGDGLKNIKLKSKTKIPTNITTIKHFKTVDAANFLSYGISSKNLYLLLLEDL